MFWKGVELHTETLTFFLYGCDYECVIFEVAD